MILDLYVADFDLDSRGDILMGNEEMDSPAMEFRRCGNDRRDMKLQE
jgi:hypothetical protein